MRWHLRWHLRLMTQCRPCATHCVGKLTQCGPGCAVQVSYSTAWTAMLANLDAVGKHYYALGAAGDLKKST